MKFVHISYISQYIHIQIAHIPHSTYISHPYRLSQFQTHLVHREQKSNNTMLPDRSRTRPPPASAASRTPGGSGTPSGSPAASAPRPRTPPGGPAARPPPPPMAIGSLPGDQELGA